MSKSKKIYKSIMLIVVVALVTFLLTTVFNYNKFGKTTSNYLTTSSFINLELERKLNTLKQIIDSEYIEEVNDMDLARTLIIETEKVNIAINIGFYD